MSTVETMLQNWWRHERLIGRREGIVTFAVGIACLLLAVFDISAGLGTYGRWFLGSIGLTFVFWAGIVLGKGDDPAVARHLRLAGDLTFWLLMLLFSALGLAASETGPLLTLLAFIGIALINGFRGVRRSGRPRGDS
ncbi:hypothetical protein BH23CHL5_BH23CHL5_09550 [soil metagenome]